MDAVSDGHDLEPRATSASRTALSTIMSLLDTNLLGTVHGGVVMTMVESSAGRDRAARTLC